MLLYHPSDSTLQACMLYNTRLSRCSFAILLTVHGMFICYTTQGSVDAPLAAACRTNVCPPAIGITYEIAVYRQTDCYSYFSRAPVIGITYKLAAYCQKDCYSYLSRLGIIFLRVSRATMAQYVARRSHNPKVVSSILTGRNTFRQCGITILQRRPT